MRSILATVLLLTMLLGMVGCAVKEPTDDSQTTETQPSEVISESTALPKPENPGNTLIEYDPDREIYVTCGNFDLDIYYASYVPTLAFYIYSTNPINTEDIRLDVPAQSGMGELHVLEIPLTEAPVPENTITPYAFPFYLYECYQGLDWQEEAARGTVRTKEDPLYQSFQRLTAEDLPKFYVYFVEVVFQELVDEVLHEVDLMIGDETYHLDIGEIRIHASTPMDYESGWGVHANNTGLPIYTIIYPYSDGLLNPPLIDFNVLEDMELFELKIPEDNKEILDITVSIESADGLSREFYWNGQDRIYLSAGDHVSISGILRVPGCDKLGYLGNVLTLLNYVSGDTYGTLSLCLPLYPILDHYTTYAIVFDGLDMESYYRDFFYPFYRSWRKEYTQ